MVQEGIKLRFGKDWTTTVVQFFMYSNLSTNFNVRSSQHNVSLQITTSPLMLRHYHMTIIRTGGASHGLRWSSRWLLQIPQATTIRYASTKRQAVSKDNLPEYRPIQPIRKTLQSPEDLKIQARIKQVRKVTLYVGAGLIVFLVSIYVTSRFVRGEPEAPHISPDEDVSDRYEHIAATFDKTVESIEFWSGINRLRKKLMKQVSGNVLEVSVGTGRNSGYYKEDQCHSITMVDQSQEMIEIAQKTFKGE